MKRRLVCFRCDRDFPLVASPPGRTRAAYVWARCPDCRREFDVQLVTVRAKRSRGNRRGNTREFDLRVLLADGRERLLQFWNAAYEDFELRQGDELALYYDGRTLRAIQNFTIGEYYVIERRKGCALLLLPLALAAGALAYAILS